MKKIVIIVILNLIILPINVNATRGCCSRHGGVDCTRVQSNGKVICNDGNTSSSCDYSSMAKCQGYNPSSNSGNKNSTSSNNSTNKQQNNIKKSSVATLSSIQINNDTLKISDNMKYTTYSDALNISYKTTDTKAQVKIKQPSSLKKGINKVEIIVTAEDGTKKTYNMEVTKIEREPETTPSKDSSTKDPKKETMDKSATKTGTTKESPEEESNGILATLGGIITIVGGVMIYKKIKR